MKIIITQSEADDIIREHFRAKHIDNVTAIEIVDDDRGWVDTVVVPLVKKGELIMAIREVRAKKGYGLVDAKEFVERLRDGLDKPKIMR